MFESLNANVETFDNQQGLSTDFYPLNWIKYSCESSFLVPYVYRTTSIYHLFSSVCSLLKQTSGTCVFSKWSDFVFWNVKWIKSNDIDSVVIGTDTDRDQQCIW